VNVVISEIYEAFKSVTPLSRNHPHTGACSNHDKDPFFLFLFQP